MNFKFKKFFIIKIRFVDKFDEYCFIYFPTLISAVFDDNEDSNDDDSLFPIPKRFRNNNGHDELFNYLDSSPEPRTINVLNGGKITKLIIQHYL